MLRVFGALREWFELRARMREERAFHLDRAAADLRALGMTNRQAKRMARIRFGGRRHSHAGLRELGGDPRGLAHLFRAHRVATSLWLQPAVLLTVVALIFAVSPSQREIVEGVLGRTLGPEICEGVSLSVSGAGPGSPGITQAEFEALQSMTTVTHVESFGPHAARARPVTGFTLTEITSEAGVRTGNRNFYAVWVFRQPKVVTSPAKVIWLIIVLCGAFFLYSRLCLRLTPRWLLYAASMACVHLLVSILAWALATQLWGRAAWHTPVSAGLSFSMLVIAYLLTAAAQCLYWWHDLRHRCPVCLDRLLLSWTQGEADRILLSAAVTESVCAHGHGVLVESRWSRDFRAERSPLQGLARL